MKKTLQVRNGLRINPTLDSLSPSFHTNKARLAKFLHVMRDRGGRYVKVSAELTDTGTSLRLGVGADAGHRSRLAAGHQTHKKIQPVRIREGFEHFSKFFNTFILTIRHVSKYTMACYLCQDVFSI